MELILDAQYINCPSRVVAPSGCMHTHADLELYRFYRFIRSVTYLSILHRVRELLETELQCFNRQVHATS